MARMDVARVRGKRLFNPQPPKEKLAPSEVQQKIAEIAYFLYEERGRENGRDVDDWLEAERIVFGKRQVARH